MDQCPHLASKHRLPHPLCGPGSPLVSPRARAAAPAALTALTPHDFSTCCPDPPLSAPSWPAAPAVSPDPCCSELPGPGAPPFPSLCGAGTLARLRPVHLEWLPPQPASLPPRSPASNLSSSCCLPDPQNATLPPRGPLTTLIMVPCSRRNRYKTSPSTRGLSRLSSDS